MSPSIAPLPALLALLLAARASAQTPCGQPGVDLAIELGSVQNYVATAGVDALACAFEPLNLGTAPASWSTSTAAHPVIALGLYRYSTVAGATRFEQIGVSWARHVTLPPLALGGECTCTPAGSNALGPGCHDVLSASGNGTAASLGPRHAIDPRTGAFAFPHATPSGGGPHPGRLQFATADVTTGAGERYVLEAMIVAADDAANGARADNATWVELAPSVLAGEVSFVFVGTTHRGETALSAWRSFDPAVSIAEVDVPGEGAVQLASRATQIGASTWHYEYVLYVRDHARGVRSIAFALPNTAFVSGFGFHDVAYHDGDGLGGADQSGANWASFVTFATPRVLSWSTATFAQDPNANALRWGTSYAFRLDCDRPPMPGVATLEPFEPVGGAAFDVEALIPLDMDVQSAGFCFGDGLGTPCPCANHSPMGHGEGCTSSLGTGGWLRADGWCSMADDTLALVGTQMPSSIALYFQGTQEEAGGFGSQNGDGLLCLAGTLIRLGPQPNFAGASQYPGPGQTPVSVRGAVSAGTTYAYQAWYRNAAAFCTSATYNLTNGVRATWVP